MRVFATREYAAGAMMPIHSVDRGSNRAVRRTGRNAKKSLNGKAFGAANEFFLMSASGNGGRSVVQILLKFDEGVADDGERLPIRPPHWRWCDI